MNFFRAKFNKYILPLYWFSATFFTFLSALNGTNDDYSKIWDSYTIGFTIIYGYMFYVPNIISKKGNKATYFGIILPFILISGSCLISIKGGNTNFALLDFLAKKYPALIIISLYTITDFILGNLESKPGIKIFPDEKKFFYYVDLPCLCAFGLVILFRDISNFTTIEHFVGGASAFQLVGFNTAFTILLIYFESTKNKEEINCAKA